MLLLRLLKECMQEWGARQRLPWRAHLWWASDAIAEGRQKYKILQVGGGQGAREGGASEGSQGAHVLRLFRLRRFWEV